jgi:hypothetical protein
MRVIAVYVAMYWYGYEWFRHRLGHYYYGPHFEATSPPVRVAFAAGALSGTVRVQLCAIMHLL